MTRRRDPTMNRTKAVVDPRAIAPPAATNWAGGSTNQHSGREQRRHRSRVMNEEACSVRQKACNRNTRSLRYPPRFLNP